MPLLVPPGYSNIGLQFRHVFDPEPWFITFGIDSSGAGGDNQLIGEFVCNAWQANLDTWQSDEVLLEGAQVTIGQDGGTPLRQFVPHDEGGGADGTDKLPQNCALLVRKNTGQGGRRNQGRFFVPGMCGEEQTNAVGVIDGADRGVMQTGFTAFFADLAAEYPMVILHNSEGQTPAGPPTVVTSLILDGTIATQRRRLR